MGFYFLFGQIFNLVRSFPLFDRGKLDVWTVGVPWSLGDHSDEFFCFYQHVDKLLFLSQFVSAHLQLCPSDEMIVRPLRFGVHEFLPLDNNRKALLTSLESFVLNLLSHVLVLELNYNSSLQFSFISIHSTSCRSFR